jgi:FixJ family two-component response regulator
MDYSRLRVAVIDDDASVRKALKRLLEAAKLNVDVFPSGRDFLGSLPSNRPDCIVLDFQMPGMNGLDIQKQIAQERMAVPIIVISRYDEPQIRIQCLSAGAIAYLCKPLDGETLLGAIDRAAGSATSASPEGVNASI